MENKFCLAYVISLMMFILGTSLIDRIKGETAIAWVSIILMAGGLILAVITFYSAEREDY